jgi:hypothetical protein
LLGVSIVQISSRDEIQLYSFDFEIRMEYHQNGCDPHFTFFIGDQRYNFIGVVLMCCFGASFRESQFLVHCDLELVDGGKAALAWCIKAEFLNGSDIGRLI